MKNKFLQFLLVSLPFIIAIALFSIPFFWFQQGQMDLGGDSSRLYFYDPLSYLYTQILYTISPSLMAGENISTYALPFISVIFFLKRFFVSPTTVIAIIHGLNLSLAFLSIYLIAKEFIKDINTNKKGIAIFAACLGGLLYVFGPTPILGWKYVIMTQTNFFVNPLLFFFLLKFFTTQKAKYAIFGLLLTFIFAQNFSYVGAPPFFAFFPLSFLFLFVYTKYIKHHTIPWKSTLIFIVLFFFIQSFQLLPQLYPLISPHSQINQMLFSPESQLDRGLKYFLGIVYDVKISIAFMTLPQLTPLSWISFAYILFPLIIVLGFLWNKSKTYLLTATFFLLALFFVTAHISNLGLTLYKSFFKIPGFSMFRNFFGQWQNSFLFYYSILFAQGAYIIFCKLSKLLRIAFGICIGLVFFITVIPFIAGVLVHGTHWGSNNVSTIVTMDPLYEKVLSYIKSLPVDGKIVSFPLTDPGYEVVRGKNEEAAYIGPSTIAYLTGKKQLSGYEEFGVFKEEFAKMVKNQDFASLHKFFAMLNVKYVFYNADPGVLDDSFPGFPYGYVRNILPSTQKGYNEFFEKSGFIKKASFGNKYYIYELADTEFLPHFYVAKDISFWNQGYISPMLEFQFTQEQRFAYINSTIFSQIDPSIANNFYEAESGGKSYIDYMKIKDNVLYFSIPTISQNLSSPIYPLVVLKEKLSLKKIKQIDDTFLERNIYFMKKRVGELKKWNNEINILGNVSSIKDFSKSWKEPAITDNKGYTGYYNYWEISLVRYYNLVSSLISKLEGPNASIHSEIYNKAIVSQILADEKSELYSLPPQLVKSEHTKKYVFKLVEGMFNDLEQRIQLPQEQNAQTIYDTTNVPNGKYTIDVDKNSIININPSIIKLTKNKKNYLLGDTIDINKNENIPLTLNLLTSQNLVQLSNWKSADIYEFSGENVNFTIDKFGLNGAGGIMNRISDWSSNEQYLLSFDYNTHNKKLRVNLLENKTEQNPPVTILDEDISSSSWQPYKRLIGRGTVQAGDIAYSAVLELEQSGLVSSDFYNDTESLVPIELRNVSIIRVPNPQIVLKKGDNIPNTKNELPHIVFKKINPTKYIVQVTQAQTPYLLVLSDTYNQNWTIFDPNRKSTTFIGTVSLFVGKLEELLSSSFSSQRTDSQKIIASYFNNDVQQQESLNNFLDKKTFEAWGKKVIASDRHILVNGYANAWYIIPSDMQGKKEYTFIIELVSQRFFYAGMLVSLVGLTCLAGIFIYICFRRKK